MRRIATVHIICAYYITSHHITLNYNTYYSIIPNDIIKQRYLRLLHGSGILCDLSNTSRKRNCFSSSLALLVFQFKDSNSCRYTLVSLLSSSIYFIHLPDLKLLDYVISDETIFAFLTIIYYYLTFLCQGNDGNIRKFTIFGDKNVKVFPRAHTCFNRIDMPIYKSKVRNTRIIFDMSYRLL